jgi:hypothetical protein
VDYQLDLYCRNASLLIKMDTKVFCFFINHITSTGKILCDFFISHGGYQKLEAKEMAKILSKHKKKRWNLDSTCLQRSMPVDLR